MNVVSALRGYARPAVLLAVACVALSGAAVGGAPARRVKKPAKPARAPARVAKQRTGAEVFAQVCAACHGPKGEGTARRKDPLTGDLSVGQLTAFIAKSMPPGGAKKLPASEAQAVAEYIHEAFYSPLAQARNRPARVDLSRLTVRQLRYSLADLVGSFRQPVTLDDRRGLRGQYYRSRGLRRDQKLVERVDPTIAFDFGTAAPAPGDFDLHKYSIRWEGAVVPPDTGSYEFVVRTEHALRLWVNDQQKPLVDAWVKSGSENEYRGSLFLLGGRAYPLRLEFSKSNQGVDDSNKLAGRPVGKAAIYLEWVPPNRAQEVIPERCLLSASPPESFVAATPLPPDDRSEGYERGIAVSKAWEEGVTETAFETAGYVVDRLQELAGVSDRAPDRAERLRQFCRQWVARAFRRPLTPEAEQLYIERQFKAAPDLETAVKRVVILSIKSPRFLYREVAEGPAAGPDPYNVASRLSFGLWDSLPDESLLGEAAAGRLVTREQVVAQAERMLADSRARAKLRDFFLQWLKVEHYPDMTKDQKLYPGFDAAIASDLRTSLELFLDQVVWSERSDLRELLLAEKIPLNGRLARYYGLDSPVDAPFQPMDLNASQRAGVLTHPYVLAGFAYHDTSSPIHRGVLIARNMLGRLPKPPPIAVAPTPVHLAADMTTRERVSVQTKPAPCMTCHDLINPLGYTLESFDAVGRFRTTENGKKVDSSSVYQTRDGKNIRLAGVRDLAKYLAGCEETRTTFAEKLLHHLVKQPARAYGENTLATLARRLAANEYHIRKQVVETMAITALHQPGG